MAEPRPAVVGILATAIVTVSFAAVLLTGGLRPATLVWTGPLGPSYPIAVRDFGPEHLGTTTGIDGQQYYAIASEFPHLDRVVPYLDSPHYRMLRIVEPAIASLAPRGDATILAILGLNILGLGLGAFALARLASRVGLPSWSGYAAGATLLPGVVQSTPDPLATGLSLLGLSFAVNRRHGPAVALLVVAALTRETTVVVAGVCGLFALLQRRSLWPAMLYTLPGVAIGSWFLYVGTITKAPFPHELELWGFRGLGARELAFIALLLAVALVGVWRWRSEPAVAMVGAIFAVWMLVQRPDSLMFDSAPRIFSLTTTLGAAALLGYVGDGIRRVRHPRGAVLAST